MVDDAAGDSAPVDNEDSTTELFQIIDETGQGWGFELDPATVSRPLAMLTGGLFGLGMLAGIPAGLMVGRSQLEQDGGKKVRPSLSGFFFAARAFMYGTALCGAMGAAGVYAVRWYYDAESFEEFGEAMRTTLPKRRQEMENGLGPAITRVRAMASESLPAPLARARERFRRSRAGVWVRSHFEVDSGDGDTSR